jgi:NAD(P)-dependent dehydrogenase (short-subunit alcohol dehydrogenase family)
MAPTVVITGASRGIGRQLAIDFARAGWDVCCVARSTAENTGKFPGDVDQTAEMARKLGTRAIGIGTDIRFPDQIKLMAKRVHQEFGCCDVLINNAAVAIPGPTLQQPLARWRLAVDVNLNGPFYLMAEFCPRMIEAGGGRVINISSRAAVAPEFGRASYTATKAGLEALTLGLAHELKDQNVAVNAIRLEFAVLTEGYAYTLTDINTSQFEHPVIMSDAALWLAEQPFTHTGHIHTIGELRTRGVVRGVTRAADMAGDGRHLAREGRC